MPHHHTQPGTNDSDKASSEEGFLSRFGKSSESTEFFSPHPKGYEPGRTAYVAVMGTVMSGLGKGIFSASLAKLIKGKGLSVAPIKLEGYLNVDSGTLNPYRHGEVFVLDDGTECDMDLGTYERLLDQNLTRQNFTTAGQIYTEILERERRGEYLGRDVQMIPHVTGEVKRQLRQLAMTGGEDGGPVDVVFIEVGGTVGDYENGFYIEALRELAFEEGRENFCFVALTYVLAPPALGEQKSKAAQLGIKRLMGTGIQPQIIACRAEQPVTETVRQKVAMFTNVPLPRIFSMHDRESIYSIPESMRAESLDREVLTILDRHHLVNPVEEDRARGSWQNYAKGISASRQHTINLGILGKYTALRDAYASIDKAIEHACTHLSIQPNVCWIDVTEFTIDSAADELAAHNLHGVIVPGGFGERGVEGKIAGVKWIRESKIPFLGICLGFQVAVIEYARHVAGIDGAHSTEFQAESPSAVISELPEQKEIEGLGGTMRLGGQDVQLEPESMASWLYGNQTSVRERFRHRYEVDPAHIAQLETAGMIFSGRHPLHRIMQVLELPASAHPYFVGGQFHPELTSRPLQPHPMFMGLMAAAIRTACPDLPADAISSRWLRHDPPDSSSPPHSRSTATCGS
ncbi:MAG: CTP synthase [Phycisphaerales bacterium]|nr:CTP synthase [Phycisphaerales bacterium]